jgi:hypothetical protein
VLKAYFDGSKDGHGARFVTLGAIFASEIVWSQFEPRWVAALPDGIKRFHMADAMAIPPRGTFKSFPEEKIKELVTRLLNVLGAFNEEPMFLKTCTVDLKAHALVEEELRVQQKVLRPPESICVDYCCGSDWPVDPAAPNERLQIEMFFDQDEPFLHKINSVWQRARKSARTGWPGQVKKIDFIVNNDRSPVPAIQAVDMIAWLMNARYCGNKREQGLSFMLQLLTRYRAFFDYERIKERYPNG